MFRLFGGFGQLHERDKSLMENVLGLGMGKSQRAAVKDQSRSPRLVKRFAPGFWMI